MATQSRSATKVPLFLSPPSAATFTFSPRLRNKSAVSARPVPPATLRMATGRSPWPIGRFFSDLIFYTPLGKALRGAPPSVTSKTLTATEDTSCILVTGATGASGSRVIRQLLKRGKRVVAMTRSRPRFIDAMTKVGVDVEAVERKGMLRVLISDLYNIREEAMFGVTAVVSTTGTKTGPVDDDADRSKYYQGIKFYPLEILEDTPRNVEFVGVRRLAEAAHREFSATVGTRAARPLFDFSDEVGVRRTWGALDDVVMGGVSESSTRVQGGALVFGGVVSTDNSGGFASTRTANFDQPVDISAFAGVQLRVRGDGMRYKFILRDETKYDGVAHCVSFDTVADEWMVVSLPFEKFIPVFRGKWLRDAPPLDRKAVVACQMMLSKFEYDGNLNPSFKAGSFRLDVACIAPYINVDAPPPPGEPRARSFAPPRFVHLSSAGVTRPQRMEEVVGTQAVIRVLKLNAQLGYLLDYKLAGEDVIRLSGVTYAIVRPTALTMEEGVGVERLKVEQGDLLTGRVARDDIAEVLVGALEDAAFENCTFELASVGEGDAVVGNTFGERVGRLPRDSEIQRKFGPFPYVPVDNESDSTKTVG